MKNVSSEFLQTMEKRRDFTCYAEVTLLDGTALTLTADDFTVDNNSIVESSGDGGIPLGVAICKTIQIELANRDEKFSHYDFFGAKIVFKTKFELSETTEAIEEGIFTVLDPYTYGETIIITALDNMYKANTYYATELNFPATLKDMLQDICSTYDIPLGTTTFLNDDFVIDARPEGNYIVRNLIGYIAMIAGGNARINRQGELEIVSYDFSVMDAILDGGTFEPWTTGDTVDGGTMEPWSEGEEVSGGSYVGLQPYHILKNFSELKVDTDDVIITGIQMEVEAEEGTAELLVGEKGYVLQVENPLISGKEQEALELIGAVLIGGQMRRFEGTHIAYPLAEFMDGCIVVDRRGNAYPTILTDVNFVYFDFTTLKNAAESPTAKSINYSSGYTKAIIEAKKLVEKEKSDRELAVEQLESKLTNASGLYVTTEEQEDGSIIYYMHDRPTLAESKIVWKYTSQAFGVSTDGGVNYPYGFSATGETIAKLLYAEGINADYITTGIIKDATGANYWNLKTGEFVAGNGNFTGNITASSITASSISIGDFYVNPVNGDVSAKIVRLKEYDDDEVVTIFPSGDLYLSFNGSNGLMFSLCDHIYIYGNDELGKVCNMTIDGTITAGLLKSSDNYVMESINANGFWGMCAPDGTGEEWIRTTQNGLIPYSNGVGSLGTSSWRFNYVYSVYGDFSGTVNAGSINSSGDIWADASSAQRNIGLTGGKSGRVYMYTYPSSNTSSTVWGIYDNTYGSMLHYTTSDNLIITPELHLQDDFVIANNTLIESKNTSGTRYTMLKISDSNTVNLGNTSLVTRLYGTSIYLRGTSTAVTSDARLKEDFNTLDRFESLYFDLKPTSFKYKAGSSHRTHIGFVAQDVKSSLEKHEIDTHDFAAFVEEDINIEDYMNDFGEKPPEDFTTEMSLRYAEFIALNTHMIQKLYSRVEELERKVSA